MSYFDAVIDKNMQPVFNARSIDVAEWLEENAEYLTDEYRVVLGVNLQIISTQEFFKLMRSHEQLENLLKLRDAKAEANADVVPEQ